MNIVLGRLLGVVPIIGSAMDSVVSPQTAKVLHQHGALGVLNLEGVQTRYENPEDVLKKIDYRYSKPIE